MARRRTKKRTQRTDNGAPQAGAKLSSAPRSMVIRIGASEVGTSVSQLVKDVRRMMEPDTAARLKERRRNRLRDYVTMCGPLGVSHLLLFSKSESGNTNLRMAVTPRGPTLCFNVERYSLCKDVVKAMRRPAGSGTEFSTAPLLVMNNFMSSATDAEKAKMIPRHLESLTTTVFQSLFPPISPQTTPLSSIRRVLLLNREPCKNTEDATYTISLRHYAIRTKAIGLSKPLRRLNAAEKVLHTRRTQKGGLPNLGKLEDIADYMIGEDGPGYLTDATSGSEIETDAEVEVVETRAKKLSSKRQRDKPKERKNGGGSNGVERKAVKLVELGPRMTLRLTKVEEGICGGKVMWHEYVTKSKEEQRHLEEVWDQRRKEKEERRRIQKENVQRKKQTSGQGDKQDGEGDEDEMDVDEWDSEGLEVDGEMELNEKAAENSET